MKKLYWIVESNDGDLSMTVGDLETCQHAIDSDFSTLDADEQQEAQYTITPVWYTDEEYANLPEE